MALFDSSIPADVEAVKLGAQRIRELKSELDTIFGTYLNDDGTWKNNVLPGAALIDASVTKSKLASDVFPVLQVPTGTILPFGGTIAPANFVFCDGSNYDGTSPTYSALFAVIGTNFGNSGGTSHFNVPDCRGRALVGIDEGQSRTPTITTLGDTDGSATHKLTAAESGIPVSNLSLKHRTDVQGGGTGFDVLEPTSATGSAISIPLPSADASTAHPNVQPSLGVKYIIRL